MRMEVDHWHFIRAGESAQEALARFFIAVEELRVRLNPQRYPNLELSDEGHLWFNVPSALGTWEVFALPEGLGDLPGPALALSFPHRPADLKCDLLELLDRTAPDLEGLPLFAGYVSTPEILAAYREDRLPPLHLLKGREQILAKRDQVDFFPYFGLYFPIARHDVLAVENHMREVLSRLEEVTQDEAET